MPRADAPPRRGPRAGAAQRRRASGQDGPAIARSLFLASGTNSQLVALAGRLNWTVSRTLDSLLQLAIQPYRSSGVCDLDQLGRRLVQLEMELELERIGAAQEG